MLAASAIACREPIRQLGGAGERSTQSRATELFAALGARAVDPYRDEKFDSARVRLASAAVLPSKVWTDTSVWTSAPSPSRRQLLASGRFADGRYRLEAAAIVPAPSRPAEARHLINLTRLSDDAFAWDTDVPYAIGSISAAEVGGLVGALFAAAEGRDELEIRQDYLSTAPRTAAAMAQLFTVDSIRTTHLADGSTLVAYAVRMTPGGVENKYPSFAAYLRQYVQPARMKWSLTDRGGESYLECSIVNGRLLLRVRTRGGIMVPLQGVAHPMPDSLTLNGEVRIKVRRFTVGFHDYHADFTVIRTANERAWQVVSRREPRWVLPLITERLIRTPLRRPFQGSGAQFRIGVRDSAGAQTLLFRRLHLEVQESAILRFLGRLGAIAVSDYTGAAEVEEMAWLNEVFSALVADVRGDVGS